MTREQVDTLIAGLDLPYAYFQFDEGTDQAPPYILFFFSENTDVHADNSNYVDKEQLNIELYTNFRDFDLEKTIGLFKTQWFFFLPGREFHRIRKNMANRL